jgi:gamma-glutamyltranspeptidase/glutathione hydrolase
MAPRGGYKPLFGFLNRGGWGIKAAAKPAPDEMPFMRLKRFSAFLAVPFLAGCQFMSSLGDHSAALVGLGDDSPKAYTDSSESQARRSGTAVADEPLAARAGAAVLAGDGSAVDAVATMFFTMTTTYPVAAGLGGGGLCLVRDAAGRVVEFDFLTRAPARQGAYAVPGAVKGFADMQRQYGHLPWQRVVAPGEAYAATGFPISEALGARLAAAQNVVRLDAGLAAEFLEENGQPRAVGSEVHNVPLSQTLGQIRMNGADGFYGGAVAARVAAYAGAQGGTVTTTDLAAVRTQITNPGTRGLGELTVSMPGRATGAGAFAASLLANLSRQRNAGAAISQTLSSFGVGPLPQDLGSTGFAAVDANGQAAACAVTMNGPFGSGHTAGDTGVVLAANPSGAAGLASAFLTPLIATSGDGVMAATGAGGPAGSAAALDAVLEASTGRMLGQRGDLKGTGHAPYDTVNAISCDSDSCVALVDPGAHGAGVVAETLRNN